MMQFFLSKMLAEDMAIHITEQPPNHGKNTRAKVDTPTGQDEYSTTVLPTLLSALLPTMLPTMVWYAHRVTIDGYKCVIAMEATTRYAMVFCGMKPLDFEHFPDLFQDRMWREVFAICEGIPESDISQLSAMVLEMCEQQRYHLGSDRSVTAHIKQVAEQLAFKVYDYGEALPVDRMAAFEFGVSVNQALRKRRGDKDYFRPVDAFQDLCGELIGGSFIAVMTKNIDNSHKLQTSNHHLSSAAKNHRRFRDGNNVIHVDFKNKH